MTRIKKELPTILNWRNLVLYLVIGVTMNTLTSFNVAAGEPFEVTREVLLESGRFPIPRAMIRTKEGGYVIAGWEAHRPWATRTDSLGNVQWRYILPMKEWRSGDGDAEYEGAATMSDDSTLLCGHKDEGDSSHPLTVGMLTRIDKVGQVIEHRELYPQGDQSFHLSYLRNCIAWGDGFAVLGQTSRWLGSPGSYRQESFCWLLALDANGNTKWEKFIPNTLPGAASVMPNGDLVIVAPNQITLVNATGAIEAQRRFGDAITLVQSIVPDATVRLFPIYNSSATTLQTLGEDLEDKGKVTGSVSAMTTNRAFILQDRSLVLFGRRSEDSVDTATLARLSADLRRMEVLSFRPFWISNEISHALPTGAPGEFVTVRRVRTIKLWPDERKVGLVLAFIRIK